MESFRCSSAIAYIFLKLKFDCRKLISVWFDELIYVSLKHTYFDVLTENVCRGRLFDGIFSSNHCTHKVFRLFWKKKKKHELKKKMIIYLIKFFFVENAPYQNECVHDFLMHLNDETVCHMYCSRNVVRFGESNDVDSIRSRSRMSLYNLNIYMAKIECTRFLLIKKPYLKA